MSKKLIRKNIDSTILLIMVAVYYAHAQRLKKKIKSLGKPIYYNINEQLWTQQY